MLLLLPLCLLQGVTEACRLLSDNVELLVAAARLLVASERQLSVRLRRRTRACNNEPSTPVDSRVASTGAAKPAARRRGCAMAHRLCSRGISSGAGASSNCCRQASVHSSIGTPFSERCKVLTQCILLCSSSSSLSLPEVGPRPSATRRGGRCRSSEDVFVLTACWWRSSDPERSKHLLDGLPGVHRWAPRPNSTWQASGRRTHLHPRMTPSPRQSAGPGRTTCRPGKRRRYWCERDCLVWTTRLVERTGRRLGIKRIGFFCEARSFFQAARSLPPWRPRTAAPRDLLGWRFGVIRHGGAQIGPLGPTAALPHRGERHGVRAQVQGGRPSSAQESRPDLWGAWRPRRTSSSNTWGPHAGHDDDQALSVDHGSEIVALYRPRTRERDTVPRPTSTTWTSL